MFLSRFESIKVSPTYLPGRYWLKIFETFPGVDSGQFSLSNYTNVFSKGAIRTFIGTYLWGDPNLSSGPLRSLRARRRWRMRWSLSGIIDDSSRERFIEHHVVAHTDAPSSLKIGPFVVHCDLQHLEKYHLRKNMQNCCDFFVHVFNENQKHKWFDDGTLISPVQTQKEHSWPFLFM